MTSPSFSWRLAEAMNRFLNSSNILFFNGQAGCKIMAAEIEQNIGTLFQCCEEGKFRMNGQSLFQSLYRWPA